MLTSPPLHERGLIVVNGLAQAEPILEFIARLALLRSVQIIVAGNRFNAHRLARIIRRQTLAVDETLGRIQQARPFSCHQVITLLKTTQPTAPVVVLDMLTPFYDDNITDADSVRLVITATTCLQRLAERVPVLVTLRPPAIPIRAGLVKIVQIAADDVYTYEPPTQASQPSLFDRGVS